MLCLDTGTPRAGSPKAGEGPSAAMPSRARTAAERMGVDSTAARRGSNAGCRPEPGNRLTRPEEGSYRQKPTYGRSRARIGLMAVAPSASHSFTVRLAILNRTGMLGRVTMVIGKAGGDIGAGDLVEMTRHRRFPARPIQARAT